MKKKNRLPEVELNALLSDADFAAFELGVYFGCVGVCECTKVCQFHDSKMIGLSPVQSKASIC